MAQEQEVLIEIIGVIVLHEIWLIKRKRSSNQKSLLCYEVRLNFEEFLC